MIQFAALRGNGSTYAVISNNGSALSDQAMGSIALQVCRETSFIDARNLIVLDHGTEPEWHFRARAFDAEGKEIEPCENSVRCAAGLAFLDGLAPKEMSFGTKERLIHAEVELPTVHLDCGRIPFSPSPQNGAVTFNRATLPFFSFHLGTTHCVLPLEDLQQMPREELIFLARSLRYDQSLFPAGANVDFLCRESAGTYRVLTYQMELEDLTASCGSAPLAAALAGRRMEPGRETFTVLCGETRNEVTLKPTEESERFQATLHGDVSFESRGTLIG